jgi:ABC-type Mn2+/Zn2+ transport system ATPase subunit
MGIADAAGVTILIVSHDTPSLAPLADDIYLLEENLPGKWPPGVRGEYSVGYD